MVRPDFDSQFNFTIKADIEDVELQGGVVDIPVEAVGAKESLKI